MGNSGYRFGQDTVGRGLHLRILIQQMFSLHLHLTPSSDTPDKLLLSIHTWSAVHHTKDPALLLTQTLPLSALQEGLRKCLLLSKRPHLLCMCDPKQLFTLAWLHPYVSDDEEFRLDGVIGLSEKIMQMG